MQTPASETAGLAAGVSFYQVLEPSKVLGPGGVQQLAMHGPFPDLASATKFSGSRPGAFITVTLVLFQVANGVAAPIGGSL